MISVIVPVYKVEKYLNRCIDSILNQSYKDFELILVDDGSPDSCGEICDKYAVNDPRVTVIHQDNGGLSDARNKGIDTALKNKRSNWITFIDSDDWVHKDYLKLLFEVTNSSNCKIGICSFLKTTEHIIDGDILTNAKTFNTEDFFVSHTLNAILAWGKLYKKELFSDVRYPLGKIHEDEFTTYKILFQCHNIVFINNNLYYYYQRNDSIMGRPWNSDRLVAFKALDERIKFFSKNNYNNALCCSCRNGINRANSIINYTDFVRNKKDLKFINKELKKYLFIYRRLTKKHIYELPSQYETAYPAFMKFYWVYRGAKHKLINKLSK